MCWWIVQLIVQRRVSVGWRGDPFMGTRAAFHLDTQHTNQSGVVKCILVSTAGVSSKQHIGK